MLRKKSERKNRSRKCSSFVLPRSFLSLVNCTVKQSSDSDTTQGVVERKLLCVHKGRKLWIQPVYSQALKHKYS